MNRKSESTQVVVRADAASLRRVCGITSLERLLRTLVRLGWNRVELLCIDKKRVDAELRKNDRARRGLSVCCHALKSHPLVGPDVLHYLRQPHVHPSDVNIEGEPLSVLLLDGSMIYDARLIRLLCAVAPPAYLMDSSPPDVVRRLSNLQHEPFYGRAVLLPSDKLEQYDFPLLPDHVDESFASFSRLDAASIPDYVVSQRRSIRPCFFPAPGEDRRDLAETFILDRAQNGTLDLPAYLHRPLENRIVRTIWNRRVTPNQVTLFTTVVALTATIFFLVGLPLPALMIALVTGVLDGVDGKLARTRVETSSLGQCEHILDYFYENSWWVAIAGRLFHEGTLRTAWWFYGILWISDVVDRLAKRYVKSHTGRHLDDLTRFDRGVRLIGGRRNIYVWFLCIGLVMHSFGMAYAVMCTWGGVTALIHILRALSMGSRRFYSQNR